MDATTVEYEVTTADVLGTHGRTIKIVLLIMISLTHEYNPDVKISSRLSVSLDLNAI